jgi:hypothetical protein
MNSTVLSERSWVIFEARPLLVADVQLVFQVPVLTSPSVLETLSAAELSNSQVANDKGLSRQLDS